MPKAISLENGVVLDHLRPGNGLRVLNGLSPYLGQAQAVLLVNVFSRRCGSKDMIQLTGADGLELQQAREQFGYLFQGGALLGWMTVAENVALPLEEKTAMSQEEIARRVAEVLEMVGLEDDGDKLPSEISGGMQKRAGLARAIVCNPDIVLYDEPTSGLDPVTSRTIDRLIKHLNTTLGVTSIVVTHDLHSALSIGHRIAMLHGGKVIEIAPPEEFIKSTHPEVIQFLEAQFITKTWRKDINV